MAELKQKTPILYSDLDLAFTPNPVTGDVSKKLDVNAVKQSLRTLILSNFYERPFAPNKGGHLIGYLFQNMDVLNSQTIKRHLKNLIETYDKRVRIEDISVPVSASLSDRNSLIITIRFYVLGIQKVTDLVINLERLR